MIMKQSRCCEIGVSNSRFRNARCAVERREAADAPVEYGQAVPEHCGLASSGCDPDAHAEMPNVSGSICCGLDRGRTFTPGRSQFAFVAAGPLRGRAALPGGKGRLDIFSKSLGQIQNLDPDHLMCALKSRTAPGDTLPRSAILLSTPGSKRWMSMVMADDETFG